MKRSSVWRTIGLGLMLLVLTIGPFFRGLFFQYEILLSIALTGVGFAAWAYGRRQDREPLGLPGGPAGWALLALVGVYALEFLWGLYFRGNLDWFLRAVAAWFLFVMVRAENDAGLRRRLGWILLGSQSLLAFMGLLQFVGFFFQFRDLALLIRMPLKDGRLYTLYQYPNTTAAVFVAMVIVALGMLVVEENRRLRLALGSMLALFSAAALYTVSRGGLLVAPFAFVALMAGLRGRAILETLAATALSSILPVALTYPFIILAGRNNTWPMGILWVFLLLVGGALAVAALDYLRRFDTKKTAATAAALILLTGLAATALRPGTFSDRENDQVGMVAERLTDISTDAKTAEARILMYKDALSAALDQPWGYGGGGWERVYRKYQPSNYIALYTHSHLFQLLVEVGFLGTLCWVASLLIPVWFGFRQRLEDPLTWSFVAAAGAIAGHSLVDFDLSYLSVWLLLYAMLALALPRPTADPMEQKSRLWLLPTVGALAVALTAGALAPGAYFFQVGVQALQNKDIPTAATAIQAANSYDPWDSAILRTLGTEETLERAAQLDHHNPQIWTSLAGVKANAGDLATAQEAARKALSLSPAHQTTFETFALYTSARLDAALAKGDRDAALAQVQELLDLARLLEERIEIEKPYRHHSAEGLHLSPSLSLHIGKALYLTGEQEMAIEYLETGIKEKTAVQSASLWLHAIYIKSSRTAELRELPEPPSSATQRGPLYQAIRNWK